jgi:hypothetical protein
VDPAAAALERLAARGEQQGEQQQRGGDEHAAARRGLRDRARPGRRGRPIAAEHGHDERLLLGRGGPVLAEDGDEDVVLVRGGGVFGGRRCGGLGLCQQVDAVERREPDALGAVVEDPADRVARQLEVEQRDAGSRTPTTSSSARLTAWSPASRSRSSRRVVSSDARMVPFYDVRRTAPTLRGDG